MKHNDFNKNRINVFFNCIRPINMHMSITIGTLNAHNYYVCTTFISKLNHKHRTSLQHQFQDRIIGVVFDSFGCITQNIPE